MIRFKPGKILLIVSLCFAFSLDEAMAVSFKVIGKNREVLLHQENLMVLLPDSVGQISVNLFDRLQISYEGGVFGFASLFGLGQDTEIISDTEMKAHGWCYSVDGLVPEKMADQMELAQPAAVIEWFYAYAHYKNGVWIGQCVKD